MSSDELLSFLVEREGGTSLTTFRQRGGQGAFLTSVIFQLPSAENNPKAEVAYSGPLHRYVTWSTGDFAGDTKFGIIGTEMVWYVEQMALQKISMSNPWNL